MSNSVKMGVGRGSSTKPYLIRRIVYIVVAVVVFVANYFFGVSAEQTDNWWPMIDGAIGFLAPLVLIYAASKANAGSDANISTEDFSEAQKKVVESQELVRKADATESKIDDISSRVNLVVTTVSEFVNSQKKIWDDLNNTKVVVVDDEENKSEPEPQKNESELSLDYLRDIISRNNQ